MAFPETILKQLGTRNAAAATTSTTNSWRTYNRGQQCHSFCSVHCCNKYANAYCCFDIMQLHYLVNATLFVHKKSLEPNTLTLHTIPKCLSNTRGSKKILALNSVALRKMFFLLSNWPWLSPLDCTFEQLRLCKIVHWWPSRSFVRPQPGLRRH